MPDDVPNACVLVVDDEPIVSRVLERLFRHEGYSVLTARDGQEGLELALEAEPDIIITDMRMPNMTGLMMIRELRRAGRETTCVLLSGYHDHSDEELGALGVEDVLAKPAEPAYLRRRVAELLAAQGPLRVVRRPA